MRILESFYKPFLVPYLNKHHHHQVETVFRDYGDESKPDANYMRQYSEMQVDQLKELIRLTQTKLNKSDRTRVMVCITMDAHARDIVLGMYDTFFSVHFSVCFVIIY